MSICSISCMSLRGADENPRRLRTIGFHHRNSPRPIAATLNPARAAIAVAIGLLVFRNHAHGRSTCARMSRSAIERHAHRRGIDCDALADAFVVPFGARTDGEKAAHDADHGTLIDHIRDPGDGNGNEHQDHEQHDPGGKSADCRPDDGRDYASPNSATDKASSSPLRQRPSIDWTERVKIPVP